jgi:transcriptional regulator with XRE-family HTH domain
MDRQFFDNPPMDINRTIAANLTRIMAAHPIYKTVRKLSDDAKVGFGTVRRAKNGEGNLTVENLAKIAQKLGCGIERLISVEYQAGDASVFAVADPVTPPLMTDLLNTIQQISERGQIELLGRAKELARQYPANHASKNKAA